MDIRKKTNIYFNYSFSCIKEDITINILLYYCKKKPIIRLYDCTFFLSQNKNLNKFIFSHAVFVSSKGLHQEEWLQLKLNHRKLHLEKFHAISIYNQDSLIDMNITNDVVHWQHKLNLFLYIILFR